MEIIDSFLLGLIQGLTEFLPISSSGHLVLGKELLGGDFEKNITFEVIVHFGTLCSILVYYKKEIAAILSSLWKLVRNPSEIRQRYKSDNNIKLSWFILISMIPAAVVGFTMEEMIENTILRPFPVSIMLLVTGAILYSTRFRRDHPNDLGTGSALGIGLAQAFAILPGISRSGSTISLGLYLGIKREEVANFSFLMVIPVIAGAMLVKTFEMAESGVPFDTLFGLLVGFITSFVSGYFALKYLIILLRSKGIHPFAWYCWILGAVGLVYFW
ncbi:undecaprenyl-diphosphate phosphatase [Fodinibius sediminis]|uniref:Undecaprenyl-diphosphatase n=1 Tax=Fodinibius sediminis TaxID=1214077 RepID=A0A521BAS8_9BACT|nr:undecaprenyl-diphosphate phosphatase [Fodinibius sediminis]SMO43820.1 Undecaprenyl-diphosphatase [Fodinibius sediminis]